MASANGSGGTVAQASGSGGAGEPTPAASSFFLERAYAMLAAKDAEIASLRTQLQNAADLVAQKEQQNAQAEADLHTTLQDLRHLHVDLEFHQTKLEAYVQKNQLLEDSNKQILAELEYATQEVKHSSIDLEAPKSLRLSMSTQSPLSARYRTARTPRSAHYLPPCGHFNR